jgi:hypothetical protein
MNKKEETVEETDVVEETTETEEEASEQETEEQSEDESTSQFDYDAEIEAERKRGPDPLKAKEAFEKRKEKREHGEDEFEDDEDKPITKKDLLSILQQQQSGFLRETHADKIVSIAGELAESDKEAQYIIALHKNRTFPQDLSLKEQLEECHAIATRKKLLATNSELARSLKAKSSVVTNSATTHRDPMKGTAPKMSASDEASYKRAGFIYDSKTRQWKKKLGKGFLIKDPKTKKSFFVRG